MASLDPTTLTRGLLTSMLNMWAKGSYGDESAVNLLVAHGTWLARHDFLRACVDAAGDGGTSDGTAPMAWVDWDAAAELARTVPASASEVVILRLACALAGAETGGPARAHQRAGHHQHRPGTRRPRPPGWLARTRHPTHR